MLKIRPKRNKIMTGLTPRPDSDHFGREPATFRGKIKVDPELPFKDLSQSRCGTLLATQSVVNETWTKQGSAKLLLLQPRAANMAPE
jgi:hypothetical protein